MTCPEMSLPAETNQAEIKHATSQLAAPSYHSCFE